MKLIFVYNADGDFASSIKDTAHKIVSPGSYPCNLCRLTYPLVLTDREWKKFVESLPHEVSFLHRDEFQKQYPSQNQIQLPAVIKEDSSGIRLLISRNEINKAKSVRELIKLVSNALSKEN